MNSKSSVEIADMEGRTFILGREGHVYIDSSTASKRHAEIKITKGKIHLRDLKSTNGTFLIKDKTLVKFESGYVNPLQPIVIGGRKFVIKNLLETARDFAASDDVVTLTQVGLEGENQNYG